MYKKLVERKCLQKNWYQKNGNKYLISKYTNTQVFNENLNQDQLIEFINQEKENFKQFNFFSLSHEYCLKISKKDKLFFNKLKNKSNLNVQVGNNRKKNYILNEYDDIPPLVDIGVFTKEGKIVASMQNKFKQINRFLEIIDDSIKDKNLTKINVIDFGCGKSYLTFIIYYYFKFIKKIHELSGISRKINSWDRENVETWRSWNFTDELILEASKLSAGVANPIPYINGILSNWKSKNAYTLEEVRSLTAPNKSKSNEKTPHFENERSYTKEELDSLIDSLDEFKV